MATLFSKIGIIGGGQLGRMAIPPALRLNLSLSFLDRSEASCNVLASFVSGDFTDASAIVAFGSKQQVIGYEREDIAVEGLEALSRKNCIIRPKPEILKLVQDKRLQKEFFLQHGFPAAAMKANSYAQWLENPIYPVVEKLAKGGYDGKGVRVLKSPHTDTPMAQTRIAHQSPIAQPAITQSHGANQASDPLAFYYEEYIEEPRELALLVVRDRKGETAVYDPVEMFFYAKTNILDYTLAPATIPRSLANEMQELGRDLSEQLDLCGIMTIEFFLTHKDRLLINEIATRPHNSAHHTMDFAACSQFEQWLRCLSNLPIGHPQLSGPCMSVNILGPAPTPRPGPKIEKEGETEANANVKAKANAKAKMGNIDAAKPANSCQWRPVLVLEEKACKVHLYGKKILPNRKIGHINVAGENHQQLKEKRQWLRKNLQ